MPSRNEHTGDVQQTRSPSKAYLDNYDKIYGTKKPVRGKFRWCQETQSFLPINEWLEKYGQPEKPKGPLIFCNHFEPFISPVTGRVISSKREHEYDMHSTGSRVYEGREQETKEAQKWQKEQESKLEAELDETLNRTWHQIETGERKVE